MNFGLEWSGVSEWLIRSGAVMGWLWLINRCPQLRGSRVTVWLTTFVALAGSVPWRWHGGVVGTGWSVDTGDSPFRTIGQVCGWAWMAGAAAVVARRVCGSWRIHTWCRGGVRPARDHRWSNAWRWATERLGLSGRMEVRFVSGLRTPAVWVGWRTWLLVPASASEWAPETCRRVCLHEAGHLRGGDCRLQWLWLAVDVLQWWNPLWWQVRARLELELEKLADAWVVEAGGATPREYAGDLLACAERGLAGVASWGGGGDLEERVDALLRRTSARRFRGAMVGIALLSAVLFAMLFHGPSPRDHGQDGGHTASDELLRRTANPFPAN